LLKITDMLVGLRPSEEDEVVGLDLSQHSENAYVMGAVSGGEAARTHGVM
jgi:ammonia channel protein AmtB